MAMFSRISLLSILFLASASSLLWASTDTATLQFEENIINVTLEPGIQQSDIIFHFQNKSNKPVEIDRQEAPCSCIKSKFTNDKKVYQPTEKGELVVTISVANLFGTVQKQVVIWLKGDSTDKPSIVLTANITVPELLTIEPRTLNWGIDEAPIAKTYKITTHYKLPIHITDVVTTNNQFKPELKTIREGLEYEVTVTPTATSATSFGIIKITSDCEIPPSVGRRHLRWLRVVRKNRS